MEDSDGRAVRLEFCRAGGHHHLIHGVKHRVPELVAEIAEDAAGEGIDAAPECSR